MHHLKQYSVILILEKILLNGPYAEIHIMFPHATARSSTIADVAEFVDCFRHPIFAFPLRQPHLVELRTVWGEGANVVIFCKRKRSGQFPYRCMFFHLHAQILEVWVLSCTLVSDLSGRTSSFENLETQPHLRMLK